MTSIKNKKLLIGISLGVLCSLCALGTIYYYLLYPQFKPSDKVYVYIDKDDNTDSVFNKVIAAGNPGNFQGFRLLAKYQNFSEHIHTGRYLINPGDNIYRVYKRLARGHQEPMNLTIGNQRTKEKLAGYLGKQLMIDSAEIANQLLDSTFCAQLGYKEETVICLFIPDTYQIYWDISLDKFFKRMQKEHSRFWNSERLAKAKSIGFTPEEVVTIASIVEEETNNNAEKPMVAGLYINRLHASMPLQADPTIKFALQDFGLRRIMNNHLNINSPYNTYRNIGLPPGPIRIPSVKGIDSVLNYTRHDYIYMCAKEDFSGTHNFAANYAEHMANARKYWQALNQRNIYK